MELARGNQKVNPSGLLLILVAYTLLYAIQIATKQSASNTPPETIFGSFGVS